MKHTAVQSLLIGSLSLAMGLAHADATSQITLGNVRITLTDLDPNDGVTPWIALNYESLPYINGGAASFTPDYDKQAYAHLGRHDSSVLDDGVHTAWASSSARLVGSSNLAGYSSMQAIGQALSSANGFGEYGAVAANYSTASFMISANTAVSIVVDASISVGTTLGFNEAQGLAEHASGHILLHVDGLDDDGNEQTGEQYQELFAGYQVGNDGRYLGQQFNWTGSLTLSFSNSMAHEALGNIYSEIGLGGASVLAPVPEPTSFALTIGGLALLGGVIRQRRR